MRVYIGIMSGQQSGSAGISAPRPTTNGNTNGGMVMAMPPQQRTNEGQIGGNGTGQNGGMSQQNLNGIVREIIFFFFHETMHRIVAFCSCISIVILKPSCYKALVLHMNANMIGLQMGLASAVCSS